MPPPIELARLAYEVSLRALERQESVLDELRARTGTLLAASSLAASFLGARAAAAGSYRVVAVMAFLAFGLSIVTSTYVLLPKPELVFALRGSVLFEEERDEPGGIQETHRRLSYWLETYRDANQATVDRLFGLYRVATFAVLAEVTLWSTQLALG